LELLRIGALQGQTLAVRAATLLALPRAVAHAAAIFQKFQPDVVLGIGGYAAGPVMLAAAFRGIPLAVLEPNAYPGLSNRWVAPYVARAFISFAEAGRYFPHGKAVLTGIPVREEFFSVPRKTHQPPFTVLVFGGSQGARRLNQAVVEALPQLSHFPHRLTLLHQTGQSEYNRLREEAAKHAVAAELFPYLERMWEAFERADLVVCRAGANTLAELAAAGRAAILVPFPAAANQHQLRNAEALARLGAARVILDRDMDGETFTTALRDLLEQPAELARMEAAMRRAAQPLAASRIVDELEQLASRAL
jgi:UDP-N-acetylglucosamine--N-acetylmuramyl-(pentapeptide) pyrophosphoryl-undecaprenol N-acetylglucosamine transferase